MNRTIYLWHGIYALPPGAKITDSRGLDYWRIGDDHLVDDAGRFVSHESIELPVTVELDGVYRTTIRKKFGTPHWAVRNIGHNFYETFKTWRDAVERVSGVQRG